MSVGSLAMRKFFLATGLLLSCGGDDGEGGSAAAMSAGSGAETDGDACIPGEERCECNQGQCLSGLVCGSNVCVALPSEPGGDEDTGDESGPGDGTCDTNEQCAYTDVCVDGLCEDAWTQIYEIRVPQFTGCPVDGAGGAEIYFEAIQDAELLHTSAVAGCPAGWGNEMFILGSFDGAFELDFWEEDAFFDDFIGSLCWNTFGDGLCGPFPKSILHDGFWYGSFGAEDAYDVEIEVTLVFP